MLRLILAENGSAVAADCLNPLMRGAVIRQSPQNGLLFAALGAGSADLASQGVRQRDSVRAGTGVVFDSLVLFHELPKALIPPPPETVRIRG